MHQSVSSFLLASLLATSFSAQSNKGSDYTKPTDYNSDWSQNWYLGMGINGDAESTLNLKGSPDVFNHYMDLSGADDVDQTSSDAGFEIYFGRAFNSNWSMELGYSLLGDIHFDAKTSDIRTQEITVTQQNIHLVAIGKYPLGKIFNVFGRGGAAYLMTEQEFRTTATDEKKRDKANTMALTYGVGIGAEWTRWGLRGEYTVVWPANNIRDDFYIADIISASLYYKFD